MPDKNQPLIVELEQVHNCVGVDVCDKLKDLRLKWLTTIGSDNKTVSNLFEIENEILKKAVQRLRDHQSVKDVKIVAIGPKRAQVIVTTLKTVATAPYLAKTGTVWIEPTWTEGGVDYVTMLAPNFRSLKQFMSLVSENGYDLKIKSKMYLDPSKSVSLERFRTSGFSKLKFASELLTDRQMEVFDLACRYGYYEAPKKISIEELSQKLDVSPSTCAELLRKAEKKLLPVLNDILRIIR